MPIAPSFRTVVNELGVSPSVLAFPFKPYCNLMVPLKTYSYWYWCLASLTFDYTYTMGGQNIHKNVVARHSQNALQDRIIGQVSFSDETPIPQTSRIASRTSIMFPINMPYDKNQQGDEVAIQQQRMDFIKQQPLFCTKSLLPLDYPIYLYLSFVEQQGIGILCTHPEVYRGYSTINTYSVPFMDQTLTIHLMGNLRRPITGSIQSFSITPDFYTFEDKK